jgi:transposase
MRRQREEVANRVCHYYENVAGRSKKETVCHFMEEGIPKSTLYDILSRFKEHGSAKFKNIPGRPVAVGRKKLEAKILKLFKKDPNLSERKAAALCGVSKSTLHQIKVEKLGIKSHVRRSAPHYNDNQKLS